MSTKIYDAWRWKRTLGLNKVLYEVEAVMKKQMYKKAQEFRESAKAKEGDAYALVSLCARLTQFQALNPYAGMAGDFTCDFAVHEYNTHYYMRPLGSTNAWDYSDIEKIPGVQNFQYWDNTDEPASVTQREWNMRGKIWHAMFARDREHVTLLYHVLDPYYPNGELQSLFDARWATETEMKRFGLPTCMPMYHEEQRKKLAKKKTTKKRSKKK